MRQAHVNVRLSRPVVLPIEGLEARALTNRSS